MSDLEEFLDSRNFDKLDFIFVDGEKSVRPWARKCRQFLQLVQMCCQVGFKCLFGTGMSIFTEVSDNTSVGAAMAMLAFVISTGGEEVRVANGKGGSIAMLQEGLPHDTKISEDQMFLNNRSGDAYRLEGLYSTARTLITFY